MSLQHNKCPPVLSVYDNKFPPVLLVYDNIKLDRALMLDHLCYLRIHYICCQQKHVLCCCFVSSHHRGGNVLQNHYVNPEKQIIRRTQVLMKLWWSPGYLLKIFLGLLKKSWTLNVLSKKPCWSPPKKVLKSNHPLALSKSSLSSAEILTEVLPKSSWSSTNVFQRSCWRNREVLPLPSWAPEEVFLWLCRSTPKAFLICRSRAKVQPKCFLRFSPSAS